MTTIKDYFSMDIVLRHPWYSAEQISKALSIKPRLSWSAGKRFGQRRAKGTAVRTCLQEGESVANYAKALRHIVKFIDKNAAFWSDFAASHGEVELILNHTINPQKEEGDKCFELHLTQEFLRQLSSQHISLRVQGWQGLRVAQT